MSKTQQESTAKSIEKPEEAVEQAAESKPGRVVKSTDVLPCALTREEKEQAASSMANALQEKDALEDQKKAASDQYKAAISRQEAEISKYAGLVRNGFEHRNVPTERRYFYDRGKIVTVRVDTLQEITSRDMTESERQATFDDAANMPEPDSDELEAGEEGFEEGGIDPFPDGNKWVSWCHGNCADCAKSSEYLGSDVSCEIETAVIENDTVSPEIARRIGFIDADGADFWECPEKELVDKKPANGNGKKKGKSKPKPEVEAESELEPVKLV